MVVVTMTFSKKCKFEHERRTLPPQYQAGFEFPQKNGKPLRCICNAALPDHEARTFWRHHDTSRWPFPSVVPNLIQAKKKTCSSIQSRNPSNSKGRAVKDDSVISRNWDSSSRYQMKSIPWQAYETEVSVHIWNDVLLLCTLLNDEGHQLRSAWPWQTSI